MYSDDPLKDFAVNQRRMDKAIEKLPVCEICDNPIQQEEAVYYNGQWCCEDCEHQFWNDIRNDFLEAVIK